MVFKKFNIFLLTILLDVVLVVWSFYNILNKVINLDYNSLNYFIYAFLVIFVFNLLVYFLNKQRGTKLKHKKSNINGLESAAYALSLIIWLTSIKPIKYFFINPYDEAQYINLFLTLNAGLLTASLGALLIKIKVWLKWGKPDL